MDKERIIELLKKDMRGEHQAIIQYLFHAYTMGDEELACEIEAIAREEMRHLDWLAETIVELGGDPTMERDPADFAPGSIEEQMLKNVGLEQVAIDQYRAHIEAIDDPKIQRLLARILSDELVHQGQFKGLAEAGEGVEAGGDGEAAAKPPERLAEILDLGIRHEYTVILQYLYHSFVAEGEEMAEQLQDQAINEMQHMGWLSEELAEKGGTPDMTHSELVLTRDPETNLEADIAVEQEVSEAYTRQLTELEEEDLQALFTRIRDHEIYHDAVFKDLLQEVREEKEEAEVPDESEETPPPTIPSVGSLIGED